VIDDPERPDLVAVPGRSQRRVSIKMLGPAERRRLLVETGDGLEPAMFWLGEDGWPAAVSTWKSKFATANGRCERQGLGLSCHAHLLRHTFAIVTLEQLQRGRIAALAEMTPGQRGHYTRIFGDPLDWVRRRLGHRSVLTTVIYLHAIAQAADLVVLLHREDALERESPRAGEADLIVAKHRNGPTATVTVAFQGHFSRFADMASD
jgi:replicative DNA helicase